MQQTSDLYKELFSAYLDGSQNVRFETRLAVNRPGVLVDENGSAITFGGYRILVSDEAGSGYGEAVLISIKTRSQMFPDEMPGVGNCISAEIDVKMHKPEEVLPRQGKMMLYVRLTDGTRTSEWVKTGEYYIDTRSDRDTGTGKKQLTVHGYDAMLKTETDYPSSSLSWPAADISVVREICSYLGFEPDPRTEAIMTKGYQVQLPTGYSCREVLGYIAAMYGGNFVMSDLGKLLLVQIGVAPGDTVDIGRRMRSFSSSEALSGYDRVELIVNEDDAYYAGAASGRTLTVECPWGTQAIANALLAQFRDFRYQPYKAENAILDPAAELGDGITANGVTGEIYTMDATFGTGFRCTVSAPWEEELDHEYPYVPKKDRKIRRQLHGLTTELSVQAGLISAKVSRTGGNAASFGWELDENSWTIEADGETVLVADVHGLEIYGRIVAKGGEIGGFTIEDGYLSTGGQYWGGEENGIYIGPSGIQLGPYFQVDRYGELYAYSGTFTGTVYAGSIDYDGNAGFFNGSGLEYCSVQGWGGNDRIDFATLDTVNFVSGVNDSLSAADWAYGVLTGAEAFETVSALTVYTNDLVVSDYMTFGGYQLYLGSFPDKNGNTQRCVQWYA